MIEPEDLKTSINVALNEGEFFLTQHIIKMFHKKAPPLKAGQLAEQRYDRGSASWEKYKQTLARDIFDHMRDLQLWHVNTLERKDKGGGAIAGYEISAGQALIDFDRKVFEPKRGEQHRDFFHRFANYIQEQ